MKKTMNLVILTVIILVSIIIAGCEFFELGFETDDQDEPSNETVTGDAENSIKTVISGKLIGDSIYPLEGIKVYLVKDGQHIAETVAEEDGDFAFEEMELIHNDDFDYFIATSTYRDKISYYTGGYINLEITSSTPYNYQLEDYILPYGACIHYTLIHPNGDPLMYTDGYESIEEIDDIGSSGKAFTTNSEGEIFLTTHRLGNVRITLSVDEFEDVVFEMTLPYRDTLNKTITLTSNVETISDSNAVEADTENLTIEYAEDDNADSVTQNLTLPESGTQETAISWESNNEEIISTTGVVNRPTYTQGDVVVTLTATISKGSESDTKEFTVIVIALSQLSIGDTGPAGGLIFYIDETNEFDWKYMEASSSDLPDCYSWSDVKNEEVGTSIEIGTGYENSIKIVNQNGHTTSGASFALNHEEGGYSDWFLPSLDELIQLRANLYEGNEDDFGSHYLSSSEVTHEFVYRYDFISPQTEVETKDNYISLRPIRYVYTDGNNDEEESTEI